MIPFATHIQALAVAGALAAAYVTGRMQQATADEATANAEAVRQERAVSAWVKSWTTRAAARAQSEVTERERIRTVYRQIDREVERIVDRPVYLGCELDADGLRVWNEANRGRASDRAADAGEPDGSVP